MRTVGLLLSTLAVACSGGTEPNGGGGLTRIGLSTVQGAWTFQVQPNTACSGGATIGTLSVSVNQSSSDVGFSGGVLFLNDATSTWSGGGQPGGYVTGQIALLLPGGATFNLVLGMPVNGMAPSPAKVATIQGTLATNLTFTGTLTDPNTADPTFGPIFSIGTCTYQVTGRHG
jgi:hypothetical protein